MKAHQLEQDMFEYSMGCGPCGTSFGPTPGKPNPTAQYLCRDCRRELTVTVTQIRSEEEARFNLRWTGVFKDVCPCGNSMGHRVEERPDIEEGVHFLICGKCNEELREIEPGEIQQEEG